jgi:serine/threonine protein kinase
MSATAQDIKATKETLEQAGSSSIKSTDLTYVLEGGVPKKLGKGGCGEVYLGTYRQVAGHVAIKELFMNNAPAEMVKEFANEASVMEKLRSDYLVQFYGYCLSPKYCLVMEFMPEGSLYDLLHSKKPLDWGIRYQISMQMSLGLEYLHDRNIFHRDIKSLNVLLKNGQAKLSDFGQSKIKIASSSSNSASSIGTVRWKAPELFERKGKYTEKSDIYSLGMTFWEIASRKIPFLEAEDNSVVSVWVGQGEREDIPEDCPKKFASLIFSCWKGQGAKADKRWLGSPVDRPTARQITDYLRSNDDDFEAFIAPKAAQLDSGLKSNLHSSPLSPTSSNSSQNNITPPVPPAPPKPVELTSEQHFALAQNYYNGKGVAQNYQTAVQYFQMAANKNHANAQGWLGHCFETGTGIAKDLKKAREYYQLAEKQGMFWVQERLKQLTLLDASEVKEAKAIPIPPKPSVPAKPVTPQYQVQQAPVVQKSKVDAKQLQTFLDHIAWGRQAEAESLLKANKDLAIVPGDVTDHAKRTFKGITGFQLAAWNLDWHMWMMILGYLSLEAAKEQAQGFKTGAWVKKHAEHANWKNLIDALQTYIDNYDPWTVEQCKKHWVEQVGGAQFKLPIHVLQEYNNPGRPFEPTPKFNVGYTLVRALPDWLSNPLVAGKDFDFGVVRYRSWGGSTAASHEYVGMAVADRRSLVSLLENRLQQREVLVQQCLTSNVGQSLKPVGK